MLLASQPVMQGKGRNSKHCSSLQLQHPAAQSLTTTAAAAQRAPAAAHAPAAAAAKAAALLLPLPSLCLPVLHLTSLLLQQQRNQ
jgi:hypothetical protein